MMRTPADRLLSIKRYDVRAILYSNFSRIDWHNYYGYCNEIDVIVYASRAHGRF